MHSIKCPPHDLVIGTKKLQFILIGTFVSIISILRKSILMLSEDASDILGKDHLLCYQIIVVINGHTEPEAATVFCCRWTHNSRSYRVGQYDDII